MVSTLRSGRSRLVERLAAAASYPVALIIAPAGFGKSVVLRQYLRDLPEPYVRFTLRPEHASLLSFLRGFSEAVREVAPHAIATLAGAYQQNQRAGNPGADLARWMHAHLESFCGAIAIDDLHLADGDAEVARFLTALIERTKGGIRWILASRSTAGLPVGTWLLYRDADLPLDERELRFTLDEAKAAAHELGLLIRDEELRDLLELTEGWPAAIGFALRTSTRSADLRNVSAVTREMIYRFLAEQVYTRLDDEERSLLEVSIALPVIEVGVLERAGFDRALQIVERLRERTAFIFEESPGIYQCHDLFREFLRHQSALGGKRVQQMAQERAGHALEASGDVEHAIAAFVVAESRADVLRLLEQHGFDLLERARSDVVSRAIEALDETTRHENAAVLALSGALQGIAGRFTRAESLFRRALARAANNRDLFATTSLKLASMMINRGKDVGAILRLVANDHKFQAGHRAEALSLAAARRAIAGDKTSLRESIIEIESFFPEIESDATRAKVLHHLGIVNRHIGAAAKAFETLQEASSLAAELHLYALLARVDSVLSNLSLHEEDNIEGQLRYATSASTAAIKAGDVLALRTALIQVLSAEMRMGKVDNVAATERRLMGTAVDEAAMLYVSIFRAVRLAWARRFGEAHRVMGGCWQRVHFEWDKICCGAQYGLFLAFDGRRQESTNLVEHVLDLAGSFRESTLFGRRSVAISEVYCGLAEFANGRATRGLRLLRSLDTGDEVVSATAEAAKAIIANAQRHGENDSEETAEKIEAVAALGYVDVAKLLDAAHARLAAALSPQVTEAVFLTAAERTVLRSLAEGMVPKEIAEETGRSLHTVRTHIANAIAKLDCHGQMEAVVAAQSRGLL